MNAPLPSGDFRADPDYRAGAALCAANEALPVPASTLLMRGYLDALPRRQLNGKANGPGDRPPFIGPANCPRPIVKPRGNDEEIHAGIPCLLSVLGRDGKLLRPNELKRRYIQAIADYCGGNLDMTARLLGEHRRTIVRILEKRAVRP